MMDIISCVNDVKASCLRDGVLFEDKHFPPTARSVYYSRNPDQVSSYVTWFRPHQICEEPQLVEDGADRHDINQVQEFCSQIIKFIRYSVELLIMGFFLLIVSRES